MGGEVGADLCLLGKRAWHNSFRKEMVGKLKVRLTFLSYPANSCYLFMKPINIILSQTELYLSACSPLRTTPLAPIVHFSTWSLPGGEGKSEYMQ